MEFHTQIAQMFISICYFMIDLGINLLYLNILQYIINLNTKL